DRLVEGRRARALVRGSAGEDDIAFELRLGFEPRAIRAAAAEDGNARPEGRGEEQVRAERGDLAADGDRALQLVDAHGARDEAAAAQVRVARLDGEPRIHPPAGEHLPRAIGRVEVAGRGRAVHDGRFAVLDELVAGARIAAGDA